jgi:hypothetical protein
VSLGFQGREKSIFDVIRFNLEGLTFRSEEFASKRLWEGPLNDVVSLNFFGIVPDLASRPADIEPIRAQHRTNISAAGGAIIEVDYLVLDECPSVWTIFKFPQSPTGMYYVGAITIPFRDASFVLKVTCREWGTTGTREAFVMNERLKNFGTLPDPRKLFEGFTEDPYDPTFQSGLLRNIAEDEKYDAQFPDHPLSRVRRWLRQFSDSIEFDQYVKAQPKFDGPRKTKTLWWNTKLF